MPKVKRKLRNKKIVRRKYSKYEQTPTFTDEQLNNIPPHLLDKIPSQMSLKPNAQSLRSMMLQRFAQPYVQRAMPAPLWGLPTLTPQQQQAQTLKNDNDIKEQTVNQARQDLIIEQERKRNLQKEAANQKHEQLRFKHDIQDEQLQLKQRQQWEEENHKLQMEKQKLDYDKQRFNNENELMKLKQQAEQQQALVEQAKFENERLRYEYNNNEYRNKIQQLQKEQADVNAENEAMIKVLNSLSNDEQIKEIQELTVRIAKEKAQNAIYHRLQKEHENNLLARVENEFKITDDVINGELSNMKNDIDKCKVEIARQWNHKREQEQKEERFKFYQNSLNENMIEAERVRLENEELNKRLSVLDEKKINDNIKSLIQQNVKQKYQNQDLRDIAELKEESIKKQYEHISSEASNAFLNSPEYKAYMDQKETIQEKANQFKLLADANNKTASARQQFIQSVAITEVAKIKADALANNEDVIEKLDQNFKVAEDVKDKFFIATRQKAIFDQMAAQHQSANQELEKRNNIIQFFEKLGESTGGDSDKFREMVTPDDWQNLKQMDTQTLINFYDEFQRGCQK